MEAPNLKVIKVREAEAQEKEGKRSTCMNGVMGAAGKPLVNAPDRLRSGCALSDDCECEIGEFYHLLMALFSSLSRSYFPPVRK